MSQRLPPLAEALLEWRARDRKTQEAAAELLSIARKTYSLFEAGHWLPPLRERHFFAHVLEGRAPGLGDLLARACGTTGQALGLGKAASPVDPAQARAAYDAAVYAAAEAAELPASTARALVASVVEKLREAGIPMDQAGQLGRREGRRRTP